MNGLLNGIFFFIELKIKINNKLKEYIKINYKLTINVFFIKLCFNILDLTNLHCLKKFSVILK